MKFENTHVYGILDAIRGARNPLESWGKMDSYMDANHNTVIGPNDMKLLQNLLNASVKDRSNSHSKFLRQIMLSVDIEASLFWFKEFDTYKVGTTANSTSTMHKLATTPICLACFETGDMRSVDLGDVDGNYKDHIVHMIEFLETLRQRYLETKDKQYWKELIRWLPESWLQTRTVTANYQVIRSMYFDRRNHKLTEWSESFVDWVKTLPYAEELIMFEGR